MGVVVKDSRSVGWLDSYAVVTLVQGNVIHLDRELIMDYDGDNGGQIANVFPLVAGIDVEGVVIEGLCADGNRDNNEVINGCIGGGYYLHRARNCRLADCLLRDFAGDGISFQTTQDIVVERCEVHGISGLGLHPGTGSARPVIRNCKSHHNDGDGFFLCWRVQDGVFEGNELYENGRFGISIGHKDTDNLFLNNSIWANKSHGVFFRNEKLTNAGSRNTLRGNSIEDNAGSGIEIRGHTTDLLFGGMIRDTRTGSARNVGINAGETQRLRAVGNRIENHPCRRQEQRGGGRGMKRRPTSALPEGHAAAGRTRGAALRRRHHGGVMQDHRAAEGGVRCLVVLAGDGPTTSARASASASTAHIAETCAPLMARLGGGSEGPITTGGVRNTPGRR
jgi:hypothetical protein